MLNNTLLNEVAIHAELPPVLELMTGPKRVRESAQSMILVRGLPGSGKSTLAAKLAAKHLEADMFFLKKGRYCFEGKRIKDAHAWCLSEAKYFLNQEENVVVSNTFTTMDEMRPYIETAKAYQVVLIIIECQDDYGSIHEVPAKTIENMKSRWERLPQNLEVYRYSAIEHRRNLAS